MHPCCRWLLAGLLCLPAFVRAQPTFESWDQVADHYRERTREAETKPERLREIAAAALGDEAATRDLDPTTLAQRLFLRVSRDIFTLPAPGSDPLFPAPPEAVWRAGRGTATDKVHLLRALLAAHGIASVPGLIRSVDGGEIDTRSPDLRQFDATLLALEIDSGLLWADPSLPHAELGQLGPDSGGRPIFLIPAVKGWRLTRTPRPHPGREVDARLIASFAALEAGRLDDAFAELRHLHQLGEDAARASFSPQQALSLQRLAADDVRLERAWQSAVAWWPSWLELAQALGMGNAARAPGADLLGDLATLGEELGDQLRRKNGPGALAILRRLAEASRWDPQMALELSGSLAYLASVRPGLKSRIHEMAIVLHRVLPPFAEREAAARHRLLLAAHLIAAERPGAALDPLREIFDLKMGGLLEQRALLLLAKVALLDGRGREEAALRLAALLDAQPGEAAFPRELRATAIAHLADLYRALDRRREERTLLEREILREVSGRGEEGRTYGFELLASLEESNDSPSLPATGERQPPAEKELPPELRSLLNHLRRHLLPAGAPRPDVPTRARSLSLPEGLEALSPADCRALLLDDLQTLRWGIAVSPAWAAYFAACQDSSEDGSRAQRELAFLMFDALEHDAPRAAVLAMLTAAIGTDDPIWPSLLEGLRQRRDRLGATSTAKTSQVLRLLELRQALRRGEAIAWDQEQKDLGPADLARLRLWQARILLRDGSSPAVRAFFDALSPAELTSPLGLQQRLELMLELDPLNPNRDQLEAAARRQIALAWLRAFCHDSWSAGRTAIRLTLTLDGQATYPRPFVDRLEAGLANELGKKALRLADAEARGDWPMAYTQAKRLMALSGDDYDLSFSLGRAAMKLGKKEEAQAALRLFLERAGDHPRRQDARELLTPGGRP